MRVPFFLIAVHQASRCDRGPLSQAHPAAIAATCRCIVGPRLWRRARVLPRSRGVQLHGTPTHAVSLFLVPWPRAPHTVFSHCAQSDLGIGAGARRGLGPNKSHRRSELSAHRPRLRVRLVNLSCRSQHANRCKVFLAPSGRRGTAPPPPTVAPTRVPTVHLLPHSS